MSRTVEEIQAELKHLSADEKRILLESLQDSLNDNENRISLNGLLTGSMITEKDIEELRNWK